MDGVQSAKPEYTNMIKARKRKSFDPVWESTSGSRKPRRQKTTPITNAQMAPLTGVSMPSTKAIQPTIASFKRMKNGVFQEAGVASKPARVPPSGSAIDSATILVASLLVPSTRPSR